MTRDEARAVAGKQWDGLAHEYKVLLEPRDLGRLLAALELLPAAGKARRVWLFDTPKRELKRAGLTLRLKQKNKGADFTVKARPVLLPLLKGAWLRSRDLELEADIVDGHRLLSAAVERDVALPFAPAARTLSPLQRALVAQLAQTTLPFERLRQTRAAEVTVWKAEPLVVERWRLPGGGTALEVSATVPGAQLQPLRLWLDLFLETAKVRRARAQRTKVEALLSTLPRR